MQKNKVYKVTSHLYQSVQKRAFERLSLARNKTQLSDFILQKELNIYNKIMTCYSRYV